MIDLSFLTKEEQETILTVLKRDAELKKLEDQRVQWVSRSIVQSMFKVCHRKHKDIDYENI